MTLETGAHPILRQQDPRRQMSEPTFEMLLQFPLCLKIISLTKIQPHRQLVKVLLPVNEIKLSRSSFFRVSCIFTHHKFPQEKLLRRLKAQNYG